MGTAQSTARSTDDTTPHLPVTTTHAEEEEEEEEEESGVVSTSTSSKSHQRTSSEFASTSSSESSSSSASSSCCCGEEEMSCKSGSESLLPAEPVSHAHQQHPQQQQEEEEAEAEEHQLPPPPPWRRWLHDLGRRHHDSSEADAEDNHGDSTHVGEAATTEESLPVSTPCTPTCTTPDSTKESHTNEMVAKPEEKKEHVPSVNISRESSVENSQSARLKTEPLDEIIKKTTLQDSQSNTCKPKEEPNQTQNESPPPQSPSSPPRPPSPRSLCFQTWPSKTPQTPTPTTLSSCSSQTSETPSRRASLRASRHMSSRTLVRSGSCLSLTSPMRWNSSGTNVHPAHAHLHHPHGHHHHHQHQHLHGGLRSQTGYGKMRTMQACNKKRPSVLSTTLWKYQVPSCAGPHGNGTVGRTRRGFASRMDSFLSDDDDDDDEEEEHGQPREEEEEREEEFLGGEDLHREFHTHHRRARQNHGRRLGRKASSSVVHSLWAREHTGQAPHARQNCHLSSPSQLLSLGGTSLYDKVDRPSGGIPTEVRALETSIKHDGNWEEACTVVGRLAPRLIGEYPYVTPMAPQGGGSGGGSGGGMASGPPPQVPHTNVNGGDNNGNASSSSPASSISHGIGAPANNNTSAATTNFVDDTHGGLHEATNLTGSPPIHWRVGGGGRTGYERDSFVQSGGVALLLRVFCEPAFVGASSSSSSTGAEVGISSDGSPIRGRGSQSHQQQHYPHSSSSSSFPRGILRRDGQLHSSFTQEDHDGMLRSSSISSVTGGSRGSHVAPSGARMYRDARELSEDYVTSTLATCWNEALAILRELVYHMPEILDQVLLPHPLLLMGNLDKYYGAGRNRDGRHGAGVGVGEGGEFLPWLFTLLSHESCFDAAVALIEEILSLQSQAGASNLASGAIADQQDDSHGNNGGSGSGGGSGGMGGNNTGTGSYHDFATAATGIPPASLSAISAATGGTFYLGRIDDLYELWGNFTCRQLAQFCRVLALLIFEAEDRHILESPNVLKSLELLRLRRDRSARAGGLLHHKQHWHAASYVDQNQAIVLGDPTLLRKLVQLLQIMNYAPDLSRASAYHVMSHFPWVADTLIMLGLNEIEDWDDVDRLDTLARKNAAAVTRRRASSNGVNTTGTGGITSRAMLSRSRSDNHTYHRNKADSSDGGSSGDTAEKVEPCKLGKVAEMFQSLAGNLANSPASTHATLGDIIHVINAAQAAGVALSRQRTAATPVVLGGLPGRAPTSPQQQQQLREPPSPGGGGAAAAALIGGSGAMGLREALLRGNSSTSSDIDMEEDARYRGALGSASYDFTSAASRRQNPVQLSFLDEGESSGDRTSASTPVPMHSMQYTPPSPPHNRPTLRSSSRDHSVDGSSGDLNQNLIQQQNPYNIQNQYNTMVRTQRYRINHPEDAANEMQFNSLLLAPYQVEVLFVLCTLLGGRRKIDAQAMVARMGLVGVLDEMFGRLSWGVCTSSSPDSSSSVTGSSSGSTTGGTGGDSSDGQQSSHQQESPSGIHGPGCECNPESALRVQYLRLVHNFCDRDCENYEGRRLLLSVVERDEVFGSATRDRGSDRRRELARTSSSTDGEYTERPMHNAGLLSKILATFIREPHDSPYRFWLASCAESFLRGASIAEQLFVAKSGLLRHLLHDVLSDRLHCAGSLQTSFDLLGEICKGNAQALDMLLGDLDELRFQRLMSVAVGTLVDSNVFIRALILSVEKALASQAASFSSPHEFLGPSAIGYLTHSWWDVPSSSHLTSNSSAHSSSCRMKMAKGCHMHEMRQPEWFLPLQFNQQSSLGVQDSQQHDGSIPEEPSAEMGTRRPIQDSTNNSRPRLSRRRSIANLGDAGWKFSPDSSPNHHNTCHVHYQQNRSHCHNQSSIEISEGREGDSYRSTLDAGFSASSFTAVTDSSAYRPNTLGRLSWFLVANQSRLLRELLGVVDLRNINHENICCLNTAIVVALFANRRCQLSEVLDDLRWMSTLSSVNSLDLHLDPHRYERTSTSNVDSSMRFDDTPTRYGRGDRALRRSSSIGSVTESAGGDHCRGVFGDRADVLRNFRELLWFWTEYYTHRGRDRLSLEFSSHIRFHEWKTVVSLLCADDGSKTALLRKPVPLPRSPYSRVPRPVEGRWRGV